METEKDISTILSEGVIINKLVYPPDLIHREEVIPYNQCYKCFEFGHETRYCTSPKAYCNQCAGAHNFRDCKSSYRKCKLCEGSHLAVSFQCPKRKEYIQKLNENQREQRKKNATTTCSNNPHTSILFFLSNSFLTTCTANKLGKSQPFSPLPPPSQSQQNNTTTQHSNINISTIKPHNTTTQYPNTNSTMNNTQNTNTVANHSSYLKEHGWEIQLSIMIKYAEMKSKGNPEVFLSVMNAFLVQQGIPQIVAPVCQIQGSPLKTNAQTSTTRPIEIIQSYVLPVSPPPLPLSQDEPTTPEEPIQNSPPHTPTSSQNSTSNTPTTSKGETTENQTDVSDTNSEASVDIETSSPSSSLPSSTPTRKHISRSHSTPNISPYHQSDDTMSQLLLEGTDDSNESPPLPEGTRICSPYPLRDKRHTIDNQET